MKSHAEAVATLTGRAPAKGKRARKPAPPSALVAVRVLPNGIEIPWRLNTTSNAKSHWRTRHEIARAQRRNVVTLLTRHLAPVPLPITVLLTRIGRGTLDSDNLPSAFKHLRDGIADWLGVNDNNPLVRWQYEQQKGAEYAARIEFERAAA